MIKRLRPGGAYVYQVNRKHGQMFVEELDPALIDALGNFLADLVRRPPLDHIKSCPSVFRLGSRRRTDEQRVLQLSLQVILLHMIGEGGGYFPEHLDQSSDITSNN
jgi:hypothetical protein